MGNLLAPSPGWRQGGGEADADKLRQRGNVHARERNACYAKSQAAYNAGDHAGAKYWSQQVGGGRGAGQRPWRRRWRHAGVMRGHGRPHGRACSLFVFLLWSATGPRMLKTHTRKDEHRALVDGLAPSIPARLVAAPCCSLAGQAACL